MTTDITELSQMKGQKVEGSYYLAECTDCGKMYPSNKLNGGEPLFSGDYGECYCPHCNADDAAIGDCGDAAAIAWNYQQARIEALVEALEKAQGMETYWKNQCRGITDHCEELQARIAELESRAITVKLPEGDERDDLVISITEEIAHLQRCVERYRKEGMASTTQDMEQRLLVQQIALSVLNSAAGVREAE